MTYSTALVVLPTYNERANLAGIVKAVRESGCEVLVVDDRSPDGTGELADQLAEQDAGIQVLHRPAKLGLGSAYTAGFKIGLSRGYEYLLEMDADGSHAPAYLTSLIGAARLSGGLALGSRYVSGGSIHGWGWYRLLLSWSANVYCRGMLRIPIRDCTSGFRCYTRAALEGLGLDTIVSQGYSFQIETVYRCLRNGHRVVEVPIRFADRAAGKSKVSQAEVRKALGLVLRLRLRSGRVPRAPAPAAEEIGD